AAQETPAFGSKLPPVRVVQDEAQDRRVLGRSIQTIDRALGYRTIVREYGAYGLGVRAPALIDDNLVAFDRQPVIAWLGVPFQSCLDGGRLIGGDQPRSFLDQGDHTVDAFLDPIAFRHAVH